MAIEFNCQYCNAIIRVPDNAGGGKGKCPRCARRITVPKVSSRTGPKPPSPEIAGLFESDEPDPSTAAAATAPPADPDEVVFASAESVIESASPQGNSFDPESLFNPAPRGLGELPVERPRQALAPGSVSSRMKKKSSGGLWLIPTVFGLVLCGVVGWYVWQYYQSERLVGELTAETADLLELPPVEVSLSMFKQSPSVMKEVLEDLERSPVRLPSGMMVVQISANKRAMTFHVNTSPQTSFYRVDVKDDPALSTFRKTKTLELEELREEQVSKGGADFVTEYQQFTAKKSSAKSLGVYRDSLALPAMTRGLGNQVVAVYGQTSFPCAYEDGSGGLYFLMPPGIEEFEIEGRKGTDGMTLFPGRYTVKVAGQIKSAPKANPGSSGKGNDKMSDTEAPGLSEMSEEGEMSEEMEKKPKK